MELAFEQKQQSCLRRTAHLSLAQEQTQELIIPDSMRRTRSSAMRNRRCRAKQTGKAAFL